MADSYVPPEGHQTGLKFIGGPYEAPPGQSAGLAFEGEADYQPGAGHQVGMGFVGGPYVPPPGNQVGLNFADDEEPPKPVDAYVYAVGHLSSQWGQASLRSTQEIVKPKSWQSNQVSNSLEVWLYNQHIYPLGQTHSQYGNQGQAELLLKFVYQTRPFEGGQTGTPRVTHWLRYLDARGHDSASFPAKHWASHSPRYLEVDTRFDWPPEITNKHMVGGSREIFPVGTEMTQWGTRITPAPKFAQLAGWNSLGIGQHEAKLKYRKLQPSGWVNVRVGNADVEHLLRFLGPNGEDLLRLGDNNRVLNRNRHITSVGTRFDQHGYTSIRNNARLVQPEGFAYRTFEPGEKYGSVTHWVQTVKPQGFDSSRIRDYSFIHNVARRYYGVGGWDSASMGWVTAIDTTQRVTRAGAGSSQAVGDAMVADRIRYIVANPDYAIRPPTISGWEVKLHTRYIAPPGVVGFRSGSHNVKEHFNIIAVRWGEYRPSLWVGQPSVRSRNQFVSRAGAKDFLEAGTPSVRNEREFYQLTGFDASVVGKPSWVGSPNRYLLHTGALQTRMDPPPVVTRIGGRPDTQTVFAGGFSTVAIGLHKLLNQHLWPSGINTLAMGEHKVQLMGIQPLGIDEYMYMLMGTDHTVTLKNRVLGLDGKGIPRLETAVGKPRFTPHTIYSTMEAPRQYQDNNPIPPALTPMHVVDGRVNKGIGAAVSISHLNRRIYPRAFTQFGISQPRLSVSPQQVFATPPPRGHVGIPVILGPQYIDLNRLGIEKSEFGTARVAPPPYIGPQTAKPSGIQSFASGQHEVDFFHRTRQLTGFDSMRMGSRVNNDTPYMWQGLRVGPYVPTEITGGDMARYGTAWVSFYRRLLEPIGFDDSNIDGYDTQHFEQRLKVVRIDPPGPSEQRVNASGIRPPFMLGHSAKLMRHYILPDGDSNQYRKNHVGVGSPAVEIEP